MVPAITGKSAPDLPRAQTGEVAPESRERPILAKRMALVRKVSQHSAAGLVRHRCEIIKTKQAPEPPLRDPAIPAKGAVLLERPTLRVSGGRTDEVSPA